MVIVKFKKLFYVKYIKIFFYTWNDEKFQNRTFLCFVNKLDAETWEDNENVAEISSEMEPIRRPVL